MRIDPRTASQHAQLAQAPSAPRAPQVKATGMSDIIDRPAVRPVSSEGAYRLAAPIADLIQAARTGQVSAGEFDQRLGEIAGQYVNGSLPAADKARQINLVARIAGLENQLVERLRPGTPSGTGPSVDQMVNDWADRFAADHGVKLPPVEASPGSLLERRV